MTTKIAISLRDEQVEAARQAVSEGRAASVSGFISDAIDRYVDADVYEELLSSMAAVGGRPSEEDHVWARETLGAR